MRAITVILCVLGSWHVAAQKTEGGKADSPPGNFCTIVTGLITDAGKSFRHTRGELADSNGAMMTFSANQGIPGAAHSNIVDDGMLHYEAMIYEGSSGEEVKKLYSRYKEWLDGCLNAAGYESSRYANDRKDLADYPTISYGLHGNGSAVLLNVSRSDINGLYEVILTISK